MAGDSAIVLYATAEQLNSMSALALLITHHRPSLSVILLSTAPPDSIAAPIIYHRLPTPSPPTNPNDPVEIFFEIPRLNNPHLLQALQQISQKSKIKALIIHFFCNSAFEVSTSLGIPTYFCNTTPASGLCLLLHWPEIHETVNSNSNSPDNFIEIPGLPRLHSSDLAKSMLIPQSNSYKHFLSMSMNLRKSDGIIVDSFHALEFRAFESLSNGPDAARNPPVFPLGPFFSSQNNIKKTEGGEENECLRWLDLHPRNSVVFLCFGRWGAFSAEQMKEIAIGLENSGCRFLWAVRSVDLLPEGFAERTKERGFIWGSHAPQKEVLSHDSVGGFVTHCGHGSLLEAVWFGVPMIGWPLYAEQRMNRVVMVEEMKVALPLEAAEDGFVTAAELEKRIKELMEGEKGREVRRRVAEMMYSGRAAVREGGSTVVAMERFMEAVLRD